MALINLRNRHFLLLDALILSLTPLAALFVRLERLDVPQNYLYSLIGYTAVALVTRIIIFKWFGLYRRYWRYASIEELLQIGLAVLTATLLVTIIFFSVRAFYLFPFPRSVLIIDGLLTLILVGSTRFSVRIVESRRRHELRRSISRVLIMGAGDAGAMVVRELQKNPERGLTPIGFLDDDEQKQGVRIHSVPVLGKRKDIPRLVPEYHVDRIIIAMPTAPGKEIREIVAICERVGVRTKIVPAIYELLDGTVDVNQLRDVDIEDLLRREPVQTDIAAVRQLIAGKRVLVTGGGGSIGSELCRQLLRCHPAELILLGHGENSIFEINHELQYLKLNGTEVTPIIADIRFADRVKTIFQETRPAIVFHAAAHKHVPLMELNPAEAVTNNIMGTQNLLAAAQAVDVQSFVMISTDKAVNPTSIMGSSKRVAELLVHQAAKRSGKPYVTVRFGNVLGSRGSVILTFKRQIAAGGPVTVTHPEMKRFFMTIPEAVQLVLQAAVLGEGGEVFVLDMGDPVKIVDLARDLIELSGLEVGRDIEIQYIGMRPGEKMFEELLVPGESYRRTEHEKVFIAGNASSFVPDGLNEGVEALGGAAARNDREAILRLLMSLVPEFAPPTVDGSADDEPSRQRVAAPETAVSVKPIRAG